MKPIPDTGIVGLAVEKLSNEASPPTGLSPSRVDPGTGIGSGSAGGGGGVAFVVIVSVITDDSAVVAITILHSYRGVLPYRSVLQYIGIQRNSYNHSHEHGTHPHTWEQFFSL